MSWLKKDISLSHTIAHQLITMQCDFILARPETVHTTFLRLSQLFFMSRTWFHYSGKHKLSLAHMKIQFFVRASLSRFVYPVSPYVITVCVILTVFWKLAMHLISSLSLKDFAILQFSPEMTCSPWSQCSMIAVGLHPSHVCITVNAYEVFSNIVILHYVWETVWEMFTWLPSKHNCWLECRWGALMCNHQVTGNFLMMVSY